MTFLKKKSKKYSVLVNFLLFPVTYLSVLLQFS